MQTNNHGLLFANKIQMVARFLAYTKLCCTFA
nr:MAG TPA: hypothetical protein [Caudoviricetes sp.]